MSNQIKHTSLILHLKAQLFIKKHPDNVLFFLKSQDIATHFLEMPDMIPESHLASESEVVPLDDGIIWNRGLSAGQGWRRDSNVDITQAGLFTMWHSALAP